MSIKGMAALVLISLMLAIAGCATIVSGKTQSVSISSTPTGADVMINGNAVGVTPLTIDIQRADNTMISIKKDGYQDVEQVLTTTMNTMFWGNFIFGGLPGSTTDGVTGASIEYSPGQVSFTLQPNS